MFQLKWMMITIMEHGQDLVKLLYFNSFVAIKIALHCDCFNKNSGCLYTTPFTGNFDSICVLLHGYELFQTGSCSFELVVGGFDGCRWFWVAGSGWFRVVADGFRCFRVVCCFSSYVFLRPSSILVSANTWITHSAACYLSLRAWN